MARKIEKYKKLRALKLREINNPYRPYFRKPVRRVTRFDDVRYQTEISKDNRGCK